MARRRSSVDLVTQCISGPGGPDVAFEIPGPDRTRLLEGLDDIGLTLKHKDDIANWERQAAAAQPWLPNSSRQPPVAGRRITVIKGETPMSVRKKLRAIMSGKKLVMFPGAYDGLSARIMEAEGFEALCAGGYAAIGSMLGQPDMGQSNMRDYADHYARICGAVNFRSMSTPTPASAASTMCARWCALSRRPASPVFSSAIRFSRIAADICRASRWFRSSRCSPKFKAALDARTDPDFSSQRALMLAAVDGLNAAIERSQLFMAAGADMAKPMGRRHDRRHQARDSRSRRPRIWRRCRRPRATKAQP